MQLLPGKSQVPNKGFSSPSSDPDILGKALSGSGPQFSCLKMGEVAPWPNSFSHHFFSLPPEAFLGAGW